LSRHEDVPGSITVFDPSPHLWRGRAYQPDSEVLRVNAPPEDMTVHAGDPDHFTRWLHTRAVLLDPPTDHVDGRSGIAFPPRAVYGDYLEQCARSALSRLAARGCEIRLVRRAVTGLTREGGSVVAHTGDGHASHPLDRVVLCVGTGLPADPHGLAGAPGFIADPYPVVRKLAGIGTHDRVVVLGSGLTAVDVVLALTAAGHQGETVLASRRGVLPGVRQRPIEHELRHFTASYFRARLARGERLAFSDAVALMRSELTAAGSSLGAVAREIAGGGDENPLDRLRRQLGMVDDPDPGLRILQRAVPDTGPDVWPLLDERDRAMLLRDHYRTIMSLCCPMPPASAATLLEQADLGRVAVERGVERIRPVASGGFEIQAGDRVRHADVVVNAVSPPAHRVPPGAAPLIESLTAGGLAVRHPRGGVDVARATSGLRTAGGTDRQIYALGDLASGSLFFTFGVPSLVDRAVDIAEAIRRETVRAPLGAAGSVRSV
jgi:uncharacterized NAD(P)/FAD-binding protein YdhS